MLSNRTVCSFNSLGLEFFCLFKANRFFPIILAPVMFTFFYDARDKNGAQRDKKCIGTTSFRTFHKNGARRGIKSIYYTRIVRVETGNGEQPSMHYTKMALVDKEWRTTLRTLHKNCACRSKEMRITFCIYTISVRKRQRIRNKVLYITQGWRWWEARKRNGENVRHTSTTQQHYLTFTKSNCLNTSFFAGFDLQ